MSCVTNPVLISVQRPQISSLFLLPKRVSTSTSYGLLKSRRTLQHEAKDSSLVFSPLVKGLRLRERRFLVVAALAADADDDSEIGITKGSVQSSKSFGEKFPALVTGFFFFMWYFLNVIFNILNKKVYNYFPYPYFVSVVHLLVGVVYCLISWGVGLPKRAPMNKELLLLLTPVAFCHALGHVMSNVSFAAVAVSFTHTIKALEPFFNASASQFVLGQHIPLSLWLSLTPVVLGVSMASLTELSFNWTGFISAMISNIAFTYRSLYSKKAMTGMDSTNVYAYISVIALAFCIPPAILVNVTTAAAAREALEGHCIYDGGYCKLHLSYSRHTDLNVKAFSDKSRDYTVPQVPVTAWQNPQAAPMYPTSSPGFQTQVPGGQGPTWDLTQHAVRPGYVPVPGAYPVQNGAFPTMPAYASAAMPTVSSPLAQSSHPGVPHNVNLQPSGGSTSGPGSSPHMQTSFGAQGLVRPGVQPNARPGGDSPSGQHYYG